MRAWWFVGIGLLVLSASLPAVAAIASEGMPAEPECFHKVSANMEMNKTELSIPVTIIAKLIEKVTGLGGITLMFKVPIKLNAAMEFRLDCACSPCCLASEKQVASLTVFAKVRAFGGTVILSAARSEARQGEEKPDPLEECGLVVRIAYAKEDLVPAVGVGLEIGGVSFKSEEVRMTFSATPDCGCTADPQCFGNTAPTIVDVSPEVLDLNKGQSATITVTAIDAQGNLAPFSREITGPGYLPVKLVEAEYGDDGKWGRAVYRVEFPTEGEELQGLVRLSAWDKCGQRASRGVPVRLFYPPVLTPVPE